MDIFMKHFSASCTESDLKRFLRPHLAKLNIHDYFVRKLQSKECAILTVLDINNANILIATHGSYNPPVPLIFRLRKIVFFPARRAPSEIDLRCLKLEEQRRLKQNFEKADEILPSIPVRKFEIKGVHCGYWDFDNVHLVFSTQYPDDREGEILLGDNSAALMLKPSAIFTSHCRVDFPYQIIETVVLGHYSNPTVTLTLRNSPKFFQDFDLAEALQAISVEETTKRQQDKVRLTAMSKLHEKTAGACFVYQITLKYPADKDAISQLLNVNRGMPPHVTVASTSVRSFPSFIESLINLEQSLGPAGKYGDLTFAVRFQVLRLAFNGFLPPKIVNAFLPRIKSLLSHHQPLLIAEGIRKLANRIPFVGPDTNVTWYNPDKLGQTLQDISESFTLEESVYELQKKHNHLALIYRVLITPSGTYLEGPELEVSNRVIRQYTGCSEYFIRVLFTDENGDRLGYDSRTSNDKIYDERFNSVLRGSITIAGHTYRFLGFSHSSLRSQSCWFCAPFKFKGKLVDTTTIIKDLGNFSGIRVPAKCAARIGQAFSDTTATIPITMENLKALPDVQRNERVFSDGCGTISKGLLQIVWKNYGQSRSSRPTVLQIRFQGVKGLLSLDTRLEGKKMCIRESMEKFKGSPCWDIEMCGANFRALPTHLNRQFIKIFEDLGVLPQVFRRLQREQVDELHMMVSNPTNASTFLELHKIGLTALLPTLVKLLGYIRVSMHADEFLRGVLEIAALSQLRELKYRARILIKNGVTLFGIMDETGLLKEGEIYCVYETATGGKRVVVKDKVVITRSPALHPGDIQTVRAVDIPSNSPLSELRNCVVFSQHGDRDLPSQLSGGDLDGDLYNIIWDPELLPQKTYPAADYPRVTPQDIGRQVTIEDMSDFFLTFMKTDQLGRISNLHMQLADRWSNGVHHPDCIKLAGLASTAVDFSKTGIPVDNLQIPRSDRNKPDFMAPGPRIHVTKHGASFEDVPVHHPDHEDVVEALDPEFRKIKYYESNKVLGQLYRDIDERKFLERTQREARSHATGMGSDSVMHTVFKYVKEQAALFQWEHYRPLARQYRATYEDNLANSMFNCSPTPTHPISEIEVFSGTILGKSLGFQSKRIRESTAAMKEDFDRHVAHTVEAITGGENGDRADVLARAIACLAVGVEEKGIEVRRVGFLKSWKYIAAAICLRELQRTSPHGVLRPVTAVH